jgi:hypothetical protein
MAGSVYFVVIVAVGAIVAAATGTIFLLIPLFLIAIGFLLAAVAAGALRGTRAGERSEAHGVPSTREASYEPVREPKVP